MQKHQFGHSYQIIRRDTRDKIHDLTFVPLKIIFTMQWKITPVDYVPWWSLRLSEHTILLDITSLCSFLSKRTWDQIINDDFRASSLPKLLLSVPYRRYQQTSFDNVHLQSPFRTAKHSTIWMNENMYITHKNFYSKPCVFTQLRLHTDFCSFWTVAR